MNVVVVESPAKAKTINKYLGHEYTVVASYGHVRDLPAKDGSVRPDADFAMIWETEPKARKHIKAIADAVRRAKCLYLATDPDREGEAISWHVCQLLGEEKALRQVEVKRVVFNEITRSAILDAFAKPRELNGELVNAYLARRALDYLVGFTLSPVLWRKLPGSRSAGRVQSVALRLVCERESEIEAFRPREYWTVKVLAAKANGETFLASLTHLDGHKLDKFDLGDETAAKAAVAAIAARAFRVERVERKQTKRHPAPPFITSTLQQEASRKLSFSAAHTMRVAQRLYEGVSLGGETVGLITYMRTDGTQMAGDAVAACRLLIGESFGARYLPDQPRIYKTKVKNAQEAHEAIRPTDVGRKPADVAPHLEPDQLKLYTLIWKRTVACQMASAVIDQVTADLVSDDGQVSLRATGSAIAFDGFLKVYREGRDEPDEAHALIAGEGDEAGRMLPPLERGESVEKCAITPERHFTQPPPRYSEASLVKRLEELGIGRPSTYASILSVLQERKYVRLENRRFVPEDRGRLVTAFLTSFFEKYVAYGFTAAMEERLDDISGGRIDWKAVLNEFWRDFSAAVDGTKELRVKEVLDALDELLGPHLFPGTAGGGNPRACPGCGEGRLGLKLGRFGAFVGCSNYPTCRFTRPLLAGRNEGTEEAASRELGHDPRSGLPVTLRRGPYGHYLQLGEGEKPKRVAVPKTMPVETIGLDQALALLSLPRVVGVDPATGEEITAGIGRFGPFLKAGDRYVSLRGEDVLTIGANRALDLLANAQARAGKDKIVGPHPADGKPIKLKKGRFGSYVEHGGVRATLGRDQDAETLGVEDAVALLAKKQANGKKSGNGKAPPKRAAEPGTAKTRARPRAATKALTPKAKASVSEAAADSVTKKRARSTSGKRASVDGPS